MTTKCNGIPLIDPKLPADIPKERQLLGAILLHPHEFTKVSGGLRASGFSGELAAETFRAMRACHDDGLLPTEKRVCERLDKALFKSQQQNPVAYLWELCHDGDLSRNIPWLVEQLTQIAQWRCMELALHDALVNIRKRESPEVVYADITEAFVTRPSAALPLVNCADLDGEPLELRPTIFDGLLRQGETANLIMTTKVGKTWMAIYKAICLRLGIDLFGRFRAVPEEVLFVNAEIQKPTFELRVKAVAEALGYRLSDLDGLHLLHLKGQMIDLDELLARLHEYPQGKFKVVFFDPLSRLYPKGTKENEAESLGEQYNKIDAFNEHHGCASVVIHHPTKGSQTSKGVTDVGSDTGMISRSADAHIIGRAHEDPDTVVVDAALRSFAPIEPFCLRWQFPQWIPAPKLDPALLKSDRPKRSRSGDKEAGLIPAFDATRFVDEFLTPDPRKKSAIIADAQSVGLTKSMADNLLALAEDQHKAYRWKVPGSNAAHYANCEQKVAQSEIA